MSRPLLAEDRFTSRELALAAELTPRNMALLVEQGLAPDAVEGRGGRGGHRSYDSVGLGALTLVGALHRAGMELLVAARLAGAMTEEYTAIYGRLPSNLAAYLQAPHNPKPGYRPWDQSLPMVDLEDDYWLHNRLRCHSEIYQQGVALRGDMVVEIVDQTYVLTKSHDFEVGILSPIGGSVPANPEYRIVGKGSTARIVGIHEGLGSFDFSTDRESAEAYRSEQNRYLRARENAVTCLRVNVALAVRNGLDRMTKARTADA
jgi:hypothetical protein